MFKWLRNYYIKLRLRNLECFVIDVAKAILASAKNVWLDVPHLIYLWHINKDLEAKCKTLFRRSFEALTLVDDREERIRFMDNN